MKRRWALIFTLIGWIGTYLPWVATTGAAFSSNLYDLAEWTSLHPAVRGGNPPLLATLLLRLVPALIAVGLAVYVKQTRHLTGVLALLIGVGLLPPFEFFRGQFGDPNYRQQFVIAVVTCISVLIAWWRAPQRLVPLTAVLGIVCSLGGAVFGLNALSSLGLHVAPGPGSALTVIGLSGTLVGSVFMRGHKRL